MSRRSLDICKRITFKNGDLRFYRVNSCAYAFMMTGLHCYKNTSSLHNFMPVPTQFKTCLPVREILVPAYVLLQGVFEQVNHAKTGGTPVFFNSSKKIKQTQFCQLADFHRDNAARIQFECAIFILIKVKIAFIFTCLVCMPNNAYGHNVLDINNQRTCLLINCLTNFTIICKDSINFSVSIYTVVMVTTLYTVIYISI